MPFINLIQEQRLEQKRNERRARSFFMLFVATSVGAASVYGGLLFQAERYQNKTESLRADLMKLQPMIGEIEKNRDDLQKLTPRVTTLEGAQQVTDRWNHILKHVSHQTPAGTWLTGIRCTASDPKTPIKIDFAGMTNAQQPVGEFILRMQACPDLEGVALAFTQEKMIQQTSGIEFQVTSNIKDSAEKQVVQEEDSK